MGRKFMKVKIKKNKDNIIIESEDKNYVLRITPRSFTIDKKDLRAPGILIQKKSSGKIIETEIGSTTGIGLFEGPDSEIIIIPNIKNPKSKIKNKP